MASFRELLAQTKSRIREVDPATAETSLGDATFLDVRELDEFEQGMIPGAVFIPRGHLESQVENKLADKDTPDRRLLRRRHPLARSPPKTLQDLGYTDVVSMIGGFDRWKNEGRPWITPAVAHARAAQPLPPPHPAAGGRRGRPAEAARVQGAAARRGRPRLTRRRCTSRPRASARSASSTWTSSTRRTCSARSSTTWTGSASARSTPRRRR